MPGRALKLNPGRAAEVTAFDLIIAMNSVRASNGLPALIEDPIIDAVAQATAESMAASEMSGHIGNVSGRLAAAGYGGGATVWGTENFAVGNQSIDQIMLVWSDAAHMLPGTVAAYCNVGAGTARAASGFTYYILQAAYIGSKACGSYSTSDGSASGTVNGTARAPVSGISQLVMPVMIATPDADGKVFHMVQAGQTFWSIAISYKITIVDLKRWNNLSEASILRVGQKLFIPGSNTAGYATPTQVGGIQVSTPDADGRITHVVQVYQTLSTISAAYGSTVDAILALNGILVDTPLRINQKLRIPMLNQTPEATLMAVQLLTPDGDGRYFHSVRNGETLSRIAQRYSIRLGDLMAWNGLTAASIIRPDQKLLLLVTLPASVTPTAAPPTDTATAAPSSPTPQSMAETISPTATAAGAGEGGGLPPVGMVLLAAAGLALGGFVFLIRKKQNDVT